MTGNTLHTLSRRVWTGVALIAVVALLVRAVAPDLIAWDVADTERPGQLTIRNDKLLGGDYGLPVELGDYDGDGHVDFVLAPMRASSGPNGNRREAGEVYVYPGNGEIGGELDRSTLDPSERGLTLLGARAYDMAGTELFSADVNGDGIEDLLVSAQNYGHVPGDAGGEMRVNCGVVYVVFGREGLLDGGPVIDLLDPPAGVLRIVGALPGDRLGIWVEAGDLDADGLADIVIGADQWPARPTREEPRRHVGRVYVIYGRAEFPASIDLANFDEDVSEIRGRDDDDHLGASLHARDLDGDGFAELIVAAALDRLSAAQPGVSPFPVHGGGGSGGYRDRLLRAGEVYVFASDTDQPRLPALIDLSEPLPPNVSSRMTLIYGYARNAKTGEEITTGDFDGDGLVDLVLGSITSPAPNGARYAGASHMIYWQEGLRGAEIDLRDGHSLPWPEGLRVSHMFGANANDILGDTLSAGDFNHDGFDDLAIGVPHFDGGGRDRGLVAIVFGSTRTLPLHWTPQNTTAEDDLDVIFVVGAGASDLLSYSMEARDVDNDGYADLFPNSMRADGRGNRFNNAGEATLISGRLLSGSELTIESVSPSESPEARPFTLEVLGDGFTTDTDTTVLLGDVEALSVRVSTGLRLEADFAAQTVSGERTLTVRTRYGEARCEGCVTIGSPTTVFLRGDSDLNAAREITDAIFVLEYLFLGGLSFCDDANDANDDGEVSISDPSYLLNFLFIGGPPPPPPFDEPGEDPTDDDLGCRD